MKQLAQFKQMINNEIKTGVKIGRAYAILRPITIVGSNRHSQYSRDHTDEYTKYLDSLKLKYEIGNDSPRGGQLGKFIKIKLDKRNAFIKSLQTKVA